MILLLLLIAADGWTERGTSDGATVETRPIQNSPYESVRVSKRTHVPPEVQVEATWGPPGIEGVANRKAVSVHQVLLDGGAHRRYYEVVSAPLISDRDYVIDLTRRKDGDVYEILF